VTPSTPAAIAVDLGGSSVRAAEASSITAWGSGSRRCAPAIARVELAATMDWREVVAGIGRAVGAAGGGSARRLRVSIPSFVMADGAFGPCPQLPALTGCRLDLLLAAETGASDVELIPDVAAAAVGEQHFGAGRTSERFLCVALGTGANAAAVVEGRPIDTAWGCLGDAGHVNVDPSGPPCPCGGRGCLEAVCSAPALARHGTPHGWADARAVLDAAHSGDRRAQDIVAGAGTALGRAIATWSALLWPDTVAVAGGLSVAGELLTVPAAAEMRRLGAPYVVGRIAVVTAELGPLAALVGAATLAA
jgi:glucokinase